MSAATTLLEALALAADAPTGVRLVDSRNQGERLPWSALLDDARRVAAGLEAAGVAPGERLLVALPTSLDALAAIFGCVHARVVPCLLSPPTGLGAKDAFVARMGELFQAVEARGALTTEKVTAAVREGLPAEAPVLTVPGLREGGGGGAPSRSPRPDDLAVVQFTSGTTGTSKGVQLTHRAILANLEQIAAGSGITGESVVVSWLPLFHDMGLIGGFLAAVHRRCENVLASPYAFLRRPLSWLEAISTFGGTHCPAPTFAYRYVLDRTPAARFEKLDLSSWRVAYVGAEPVHPSVLADFCRVMAPHGFGASTFLPCYGMAEASLAVTFPDPDAPYRTVEVGRRALVEEGRARPPEGAHDALEQVSCGRPLPGTEVFVRREDGSACAPGEVGQVWFRGPSLFEGYFGRGREGFDAGGAFATGDLGFLDDRGELFVTGRIKDVIIVGGENHAPSELEWAAAEVEGVRRVAAFGVSDAQAGTEQVCLLVEVERKTLEGDRGAVVRAVRRRVHERTGLGVHGVELVAPGGVPVTTSGKVQRGQAREAFLAARAAPEQGERSPVT